MKQSTNHLMTTAEADRLINAAAKSQFGAIEDAAEAATTVTYFFEGGVQGRVCLRTGAVTFKVDPVYE
jgi:hypothetical protein